MYGLIDRFRAIRRRIPLTMIFSQQLRVVFGSKMSIPVGDRHGIAWQALFNVDLPTIDADEALLISRALPRLATEGAV